MRRVLFVLLLLAPLSAAQEKVQARRLSDVVAVRAGALAAERVLYYFNPTVELQQGDELEQGSGGHSEMELASGGLLVLHANAHVLLERLAAEGDALRLPLFTRLEAQSGERPLQLLMPGGTVCELLGTHVTAYVEHGRLRVRNEGSTPVVVTSDLRLERNPPTDGSAGRMELVRGEEVRLVLVGGDVALPVRHDSDVEVQPEGDRLRLRALEGAGAGTRSLTVRGVRTLAGSALVLHDPAHIELPSTPATPPADEAQPAPPADEQAEAPGSAEDAPPPEDDAGAPGDEPR
jgi:hypothetical protein